MFVIERNYLVFPKYATTKQTLIQEIGIDLR